MMKRSLSQSAVRCASGMDVCHAAPIWTAQPDEKAFPRLTQDLHIDVAIIGADVCGITTAHLLKSAGFTVVVLEAETVGGAAATHASGVLDVTADQSLQHLSAGWGQRKTAAILAGRSGAIDLIEANITQHALHCDFARVPRIFYSTTTSDAEQSTIQTEARIAQDCGLLAWLARDLPLPYMTGAALVIAQQAQCDPRRYVRQLAKALASPQCQIVEHSPVIRLNAARRTLHTAAHTVRVKHIVMTTHSAPRWNASLIRLCPWQELAVAAPIESTHMAPAMGPAMEPAILCSVGEHATTTRLLQFGQQRYALMTGEQHPLIHNTTNHATGSQRHAMLETRLQSSFLSDAVRFKWTNTYYPSADGMPMLAHLPGALPIYLAGGFGQAGLVQGTLVAQRIAKAICGLPDPWQDICHGRNDSRIKRAIRAASHELRRWFDESGKTNLRTAGHRSASRP